MSVRAKFYVYEIEDYGQSKKVKMMAAYDDGIPENQRFARASPAGELWITIDNPAAAEQFAKGRYAYIDINWCDER